jgi:glycosyltransferase involved in cell wall biosynthesis
LHLGHAAAFWSEVHAIQDLLRDIETDVVLINGLVNAQAAFASRLAGVPLVWQLIDTRSPMVLRRLLMPIVTSLSDAVMTTGDIVARLHPGAEKIGDRLVPFFPPVDCKTFYPGAAERQGVRQSWGVDDDDLVLGSTANLNPQKGIEYLIDAFALVRQKDHRARLVLIGPEYATHKSYSVSLRHLLLHHGLREGQDVIFVGPRSDLERQLQGFDVYMLGSVPNSEGTPTAVMEAMACGLPCVATNVGGVSEVVDQGETGFLVPPLSPPELSDAALRLLGDAVLRRQMGEAGRRKAETLFDTKLCAASHIRAFEIAMRHHALRRKSRSLGSPA